MEECSHQVLVLCTTAATKLRCRHCHLTLAPEDLDGGCCPECHEERGLRHSEFDEIETPDAGTVRYRCEQCALVIEIEP